MKRVKVDLEHCYGIKKLKTEFDFEHNGNVVTVYAPNGVMKTSFAIVFKDLSQGNLSSDRVWPTRVTKRFITDETGTELPSDSVFVVEPYNDSYRSEKISTLLVNEDLRKRYDSIHKSIDEKTESLITELKPRTGLKDGVREELADAIMHDRNDLFRALGRIKEEVRTEDDSPIADVVYSHIFNPKVSALLTDQSFRESLSVYIEKYDDLLSKSTFFRKGVFTHNNASDVATSLNNNGFFKASHSVFLRINGEKKEITTIKELEDAIKNEKQSIISDKELMAAFDTIDDQLKKNTELRTFRKCLLENPVVLPELINPDRLRGRLWVAYLVRSRDKFNDLIASYEAGKQELSVIVEEAKKETTKWAEVINIFNDRFSVPFVVRMENQDDVILKRNTPSLAFDFLDDIGDSNSVAAPIAEGPLLQVLSNGERRAFYLLNIIFEVEARKATSQPTLFVFDDIADSFDYKNKYAIIEYLKEVSEQSQFQQLILSHNFDFYRTVSSRLNVKRSNRMFATKSNDEVFLSEEHYQNPPLVHWRKNLNNDRMLIASIPMLRNLAEFSGNKTYYEKLTSLLHIKVDTATLTIGDLETWIKVILHDQAALTLTNKNRIVKDVIHSTAEVIVKEGGESHALEDKVVLSIAIRLGAEEKMMVKINDAAFVNSITSKQTIELINRYKVDFPSNREEIQLFDQVNLMTPENIHLNSFMYEPILDMSSDHLKKLYQRLLALT